MRLQNVMQLEKQGFIPPNWQGSTQLQSPAALNTGPLLGSTESDISERGMLPSVLCTFVFTVNSCFQAVFGFKAALFGGMSLVLF